MGILSDQSPEARRKRLMFAGGGAVLLALLFLMTRGGGGTDAPDDTSGLTSSSVPTTFADNGASMGQLTEDVAGGLYGVQTSLDGVTTTQQTTNDTLGELLATNQTIADALTSKPAPAAIAAAGTNANSAGTVTKKQAHKMVATAKRTQARQDSAEAAHKAQRARAKDNHAKATKTAQKQASKRQDRTPSTPSHTQKVHKSPHKKR